MRPVESLLTRAHAAEEPAQPEPIADPLAQAQQVSPRWAESYPQVLYDPRTRRLLCHPPAHGPCIARIDPPHQSPVRLFASIGHAKSHPIEFAALSAQGIAPLVLKRFEAPDLEWHRLSPGEIHLLRADCTAPDSKLYVAARMAPDASNNYFGWAHFSDVLAIGEGKEEKSQQAG